MNEPGQAAALEMDWWDPEPRAQGFTTTHWSVVLQAGQAEQAAAARALEELCRKYWHPIYAFTRRRAASREEAQDLTQAFFAFLLEKQVFTKADPQKGRFRCFLLTALTNFLSNEWGKQQTLKRGGQFTIVSLDALVAEEGFDAQSAEALGAEAVFERRWALTLLGHVLSRLEQQYFEEGKAGLFARLEPALTAEVTGDSYDQWGRALGMSVGALKVALHRLRRRFGELLRQEVAQTVASSAEVDAEIRHLFAAISV